MEFLPEKVWARIDKIIQVKYNGNITKFADALEFDLARVTNPMYRKTIPLSLIVAIKIKLKISSDFILFGDTNPFSTPREFLED